MIVAWEAEPTPELLYTEGEYSIIRVAVPLYKDYVYYICRHDQTIIGSDWYYSTNEYEDAPQSIKDKWNFILRMMA